MKNQLNESPRTFSVNDIEISDYGKIELAANEQITLVNDSGQNYDIVAKNWGYYATPSVNSRLTKEGFKTALVKNSFNRYFIMIVKKGSLEQFQSYLESDNQELVEWLDERT